MTIIYVTENNCQHSAVTFNNNGLVKVQNLKIFLRTKILYMKSILLSR